ncbi:NIT2 Deaminated glutathione amidase [Candida maltosa Xu316]|uniref:Nitrilase superfamily protein n=1 Tax=Candida maltosa (strain Xu316) TaxID=1245528 RepID=M3JT07_CANMX|nr:Nitrilase superfamily protein [Candida maltosa Xu316]
MTSLKIAVGQLCSSSNLSQNLRVVKKLLQKAQSSGSKILFLPEATDYISRNANHSIDLSRQVQDQFLSPLLSHIKSSNGSTYVSIGVHLPGENKVKNLHFLIDPKGEIVSQYQKVHLFDVDVPNGPILKESNSVEPGNRIEEPVLINGFKVGLGICYDIRFPELAIRLRKDGADIITFPSAFTTKTGEAHWELLSKARAVDTQTFVINAAQCGQHDVGSDPDNKDKVITRVSYGDSIVVDPWGKILARGKKYTDTLEKDADGDYLELITAELDKDGLSTIRQNMPLLDHRRPDVYRD